MMGQGQVPRQTVVARLLAGLADLFYPPCCLYCGTKTASSTGVSLCGGCWEKLRFLDQRICQQCGEPYPGGGEPGLTCQSCLSSPPAYKLARSAVIYEPVVAHLLHRLKFQADLSALPALDKILDRCDLSVFKPSQLLLPVPLHPLRLRDRTLNQSVYLAKLLQQRLGCNLAVDSLGRQRHTTAQTSLSGTARRQNLAGAFTVKKAELLQDRVVCLVDDILTTGTTVEECSRCLLAAGAAEVLVCTIARVIIRKR